MAFAQAGPLLLQVTLTLAHLSSLSSAASSSRKPSWIPAGWVRPLTCAQGCPISVLTSLCCTCWVCIWIGPQCVSRVQHSVGVMKRDGVYTGNGRISLSKMNKNKQTRSSLVVQWTRICLLKQGTWVQSLVQEDSTCQGATKPVHHYYQAHMP